VRTALPTSLWILSARLNEQRDPVTRLPSRQWNVLEAVQQQPWWAQVIGEGVNRKFFE